MSYQMEQNIKTMCDPTIRVVDREKNGDKCPVCGSVGPEIIMHDFSTNKSTFDDLWTCTNRNCGEQFIMRTKRRR